MADGWLAYMTRGRPRVHQAVRACILDFLKDVAAGYGISYPTVRLRLDRLIAKIAVVENMGIRSEFERLLRTQHAEGRIDADTLKTLLAAHRKDRESQQDRRLSASFRLVSHSSRLSLAQPGRRRLRSTIAGTNFNGRVASPRGPCCLLKPGPRFIV